MKVSIFFRWLHPFRYVLAGTLDYKMLTPFEVAEQVVARRRRERVLRLRKLMEYLETMLTQSFEAVDGRGCMKADGVLGGSRSGTIRLQAAMNKSSLAGSME
ncbi:v-type proton ATPase subunit G, partial [Striga asiatica]